MTHSDIPTMRGTEPPKPTDVCDETLVKAIASGDLTHFDTFVDRYKRQLVAFVRCRLWDCHQAEDIAQDVFISVFIAVRDGQFRSDSGSIRAYLFTIASNLVYDHHKRRLRSPFIHAQDADSVCVSDESSDPHTVLVNAETRDAVMTGLASLPDEQRQAIGLKIFGELTTSEISQALRCPVATVKSRIRLGFAKLKRIVSDQDGAL